MSLGVDEELNSTISDPFVSYQKMHCSQEMGWRLSMIFGLAESIELVYLLHVD